MKRILFLFVFILTNCLSMSYAGVIPDIVEKMEDIECKYAIRDNALVIVLQPHPDGSGDFMFTVCNKNSHCRQTSMEYSEMRYIGLYLEDLGSAILKDLVQELSYEQWKERREAFSASYTMYMNAYDKKNGAPQLLYR